MHHHECAALDVDIILQRMDDSEPRQLLRVPYHPTYSTVVNS